MHMVCKSSHLHTKIFKTTRCENNLHPPLTRGNFPPIGCIKDLCFFHSRGSTFVIKTVEFVQKTYKPQDLEVNYLNSS